MKAHSVVALGAVASDDNRPGEFCIVAVHPRTGRLLQTSGCDLEMAEHLVDLIDGRPSTKPAAVRSADVSRCARCHSPVQRDLVTLEPYCIADRSHQVVARVRFEQVNYSADAIPPPNHPRSHITQEGT